MRKNKIIVAFSSHLGIVKDDEFINHIHKTIGTVHDIIRYENNNEYSLPELYNKVLNNIKDENVIIVFCHPDIEFKTKNWGKHLLGHFNNSRYGIIGLAGTTYLAESGIWWENKKNMFGIVNHTDGVKEWESKFSEPIHGIQPVVTIDGVFIAVDPLKLEYKFDKTYGKFHYYDISLCVPNYIAGVDIGVVTSIRILHKSIGMTNADWDYNRVKFSQQYEQQLPLILDPDFKDINVKLPIEPIVTVIIPTKNNFDVLSRNINSWKEVVNYGNYEIIIADTGSDPDVIKKYEELIDDRIKLVKYNYYNFGQINNDVVKNHTSEYSELILFCNDDIELLNDALTRCVQVYQTSKNVGTIGIRLHFGNSLVQHCGIIFNEDSQGALHLSHVDMGKSNNYFTGVNYKSQGNTAAFMMINRQLFLDLGAFNETYIECFEDVELNFNCLLKHKKNITVCDAVAFHYESTSRNRDVKKLDRLQKDYIERLYPFYNTHRAELRRFIK